MPDAKKSVEIYLYLLERQDSTIIDDNTRCIVAAPSEKAAREQANAESGMEGYVWTDGQTVNAKELGVANEGVSGVLMFAKE